MTVTAGRAQQVNFTIPYYREGVGLLLMKNGKYKSFDELKAAGIVGDRLGAAERLCRGDGAPGAAGGQGRPVRQRRPHVPGAEFRPRRCGGDRHVVGQVVHDAEPRQYIDAGYGWNPQTYSCAVKRGDPDWLNFVNIALREAMTGVEFATYAASFEKWFGEEPPAPKIGFPGELR